MATILITGACLGWGFERAGKGCRRNDECVSGQICAQDRCTPLCCLEGPAEGCSGCGAVRGDPIQTDGRSLGDAAAGDARGTDGDPGPCASSGVGCDDGIECTHSDSCDGSGACVGIAYACGTCQDCDGSGGCSTRSGCCGNGACESGENCSNCADCACGGNDVCDGGTCCTPSGSCYQHFCGTYDDGCGQIVDCSSNCDADKTCRDGECCKPNPGQYCNDTFGGRCCFGLQCVNSYCE